MVHESKLHSENSFVTLTYSDDHLPVDGSLSPEALQRFVKRLRFRVSVLRGDGGGLAQLRYFAAGEYGDTLGRPHYHLIVFGFFPHDARKWRQVRGHLSYRSSFLEEVWPFGHVEVGTVSPLSCGYVARYAMKKLTGDAALEAYVRAHPLTGQPFTVLPEFARMSRRPGIGAGWFEKFRSDAFPSDFCVVDGQRVPVPNYYKLKLGELEQLTVKSKRVARAAPHAANRTPERLKTRAEVVRRRTSILIRPVE